MAKKEITEFSTYIISILGISWSIILGLLSYIWHTSIKANSSSVSELKKEIESLDEKIDLCVLKIDFETHKENNRSDISELHKRIDALLKDLSKIMSDLIGVQKKIEGHMKLCDRTHKEN